jgi:hypothetical protein
MQRVGCGGNTDVAALVFSWRISLAVRYAKSHVAEPKAARIKTLYEAVASHCVNMFYT